MSCGTSGWTTYSCYKRGSVKLSELKLENVLFVPSLKCNLISVSQLIDQVDCIVQFTKKLCVMQGRTLRMLIGAGERRDGLYYFRVAPQAMSIKNGTDSLDLWHKRLGHPSLRVTKLVSNVVPTNDSEVMNKACDVCQRAKQTRDRFPLSENKACDKFELKFIHHFTIIGHDSLI